MSNKKDIFNKEHQEFTFEILQQYINGNLPADQVRLLEKAMIDDPFLADAVEGLSEQNGVDSKKIIERINKNILPSNPSKVRPLWIPISLAASVIVAFVLIYNTMPNREYKMESLEVSDSTSMESETATSSSTEPSTIVVDSTRLPIAVTDFKISSPLSNKAEPCPPTPIENRNGYSQNTLETIEEKLPAVQPTPKGEDALKFSTLKEEAGNSVIINDADNEKNNESLALASSDKIVKDMIIIAENEIFNREPSQISKKEIDKKASKENKKKDCINCPDVTSSYQDAQERAILSKELGIKKYKQQKWTEAKDLFESVLKQNSKDEQAQALLMICNLQLDEQLTTPKESNKATDMNQWIKAISLIKNGKTDVAKSLLMEIATSSSSFGIKAKEVLSKLE